VKTRIFTRILPLALMIVSLTLLTSTVAHAQENAIFSVSPGSFTVTDVPIGEIYTSPQHIVVRNGDNVARAVSITVEVPPANETTPGYAPIPNANWVIPSASSILISENSDAEIQISLNIPRQENLTGQRWEVWIPVERQANPGEIGVLRPTVRMKIETTTQPPEGKSTTSLTISEENFYLGESVISDHVHLHSDKYLTATLTSNGNPVEGENIIWSATAGTIDPSSGKTDNGGQVSVLYTAPTYNTFIIMSASYAGSDQYESSSASSYGTIFAISGLIISEKNFTLQPGKSKILTATLNSMGNLIDGENIIWSATAGTIDPSSVKTNAAGQVSVSYTAPNYETSVTVKASYVGGGLYDASSDVSFGTITAPSGGVSTGVIIGIAIVIGCGIIGAAILLVGRH